MSHCTGPTSSLLHSCEETPAERGAQSSDETGVSRPVKSQRKDNNSAETEDDVEEVDLDRGHSDGTSKSPSLVLPGHHHSHHLQTITVPRSRTRR